MKQRETGVKYRAGFGASLLSTRELFEFIGASLLLLR